MKRRSYLMRYARALAGDLGLTDEERRELAMRLPSQSHAQGPVSWGKLTVEELAIMVHWLNGALTVYELLRLRPPVDVASRETLEG